MAPGQKDTPLAGVAGMVAGELSAIASRGLAGELADQYRQFYGADVQTIEGEGSKALVAILPQGRKIENLKPLLDAFRKLPERRRGTAQIKDEASFVAHLARFKGEASVVFANPDRDEPSLLAVFDYHPKNGEATNADWLAHRARYAPELSDEWEAWTAAAEAGAMAQGVFAEFLEDRIADVLFPDFEDPKLVEYASLVQGRYATPSQLVTLSRGLQINVNAQVQQVVTLSTGEVNVKYAEVHTDGAGEPVKVPNLFVIAIPVFFGGPRYRIKVRLRYRIAGQRMTWAVLPVDTDHVFDNAFAEIVNRVHENAGVPVFLGSPEA